MTKKELATRFANGMQKKRLGAYAASTAFFFFLSFIPILILLSALLPYIGMEEAVLVRAVTAVTPDIVDELVVSMISDAYDSSRGILPISLLLTIWSAAKGMQALINGFDEIYDVDEKRNWFGIRGMASVYTFLLMILILAMLVLMVFGVVIRDNIISLLPEVPVLSFFLSGSRYLVLIGISIGLFILIYAFVPGERQPVKKQIPGAIFSAVAWAVFSFFFSLFINSFDSYSAYYGSLAALIFLLFWLYWCSYILLIGAYLNAFRQGK